MHSLDHSQNAAQPASGGQPSRETAAPGSAVTDKRTPGPWFPVWNGSYWEISIADNRYAPSIAAVWARIPRQRLGAEADARLIAAAPDLLDFAKNVAGLDDRLLTDVSILRQWRDDARALFAKAGCLP